MEHKGSIDAEGGLNCSETDLLPPTDSNDVLVVTKKLPYLEMNFIGTYAAVCLGTLASLGGFIMPATSLQFIDQDLGPSPNIYWVSLAWTLCLAVGYTLVGRLSDIFGRRWFFVVSSALATIGCIVGGTATNIDQLIGANVIIGLASAAQQSFNYTLGELVPIKHRFYVLCVVFIVSFPFAGLGPYIARLFIVHTAAGWRWSFYCNIIINGLSTILYIIFYHPPKFDELHRGRSRMRELLDLDFGGIFLFTSGLLLFLMGLSWGGTIYPWHSAHVIATLVVGIVLCIAFVLYECLVPLKRPLIPMHLFKNRDYCVLVAITTIGGMVYYSLNVVYPTMVSTLFTTDPVTGGLLVSAIGCGVFIGQIGASLGGNFGGNIRWKLFLSVAGVTAFTAGMAAAKTEGTATALILLASMCVGLLEIWAGVCVTIVIRDQTEIGAAAGAYSSVRASGGVVATAIFSTIITNRVKFNIQDDVAPALIESGLAPSSVAQLLADIQAGDAPSIMLRIPGVTMKILGIASETFKAAYSNAFTLLFLVTIAFGGVVTIISFWAPAVEDRLTSDIARRLHKAKESDVSVAGTEKSVGEHSSSGVSA